MGRAALLISGVGRGATGARRRCLLGALLLLSLSASAADRSSPPAPPAPPARILGIEGALADPAVARHVEFGLAAGFDALWVRSDQAGRWTESDAPAGPELDPAFLRLAARARERNARLFLEIRPADWPGGFVFSDRLRRNRLLRFVALACRRAAVRDVVLSFDGAPTELTDLRDLLEYGRIAAGAHVDLARSVERRSGRSVTTWLAPALSDDARLGDARLRYPVELFEAIARLPPRVGLVWSGPLRPATRIEAGDLERTARRFPGRRLLLDERFPANASGAAMPLALVLGPLRERDPAIVSRLAGYLVRPMAEQGASRLALLTAIDFLTDPAAYDPDRSWRAAMERLAGPNPGALEALRVQAVEWGGWIGARNYHTALTENPYTAAQGLRDPAEVARWSWTVKTYPARMSALAALGDRDFREDLLLAMARRLAVARSVPLARELLARSAGDPAETASLRRQIAEERRRVAERPEVREALDRFLVHAGLGSLVTAAPESAETTRPERESRPGGSAW